MDEVMKKVMRVREIIDQIRLDGLALETVCRDQSGCIGCPEFLPEDEVGCGVIKKIEGLSDQEKAIEKGET